MVDAILYYRIVDAKKSGLLVEDSGKVKGKGKGKRKEERGKKRKGEKKEAGGEITKIEIYIDKERKI
jgi:hypothetical protein